MGSDPGGVNGVEGLWGAGCAVGGCMSLPINLLWAALGGWNLLGSIGVGPPDPGPLCRCVSDSCPGSAVVDGKVLSLRAALSPFPHSTLCVASFEGIGKFSLHHLAARAAKEKASSRESTHGLHSELGSQDLGTGEYEEHHTELAVTHIQSKLCSFAEPLDSSRDLGK